MLSFMEKVATILVQESMTVLLFTYEILFIILSVPFAVAISNDKVIFLFDLISKDIMYFSFGINFFEENFLYPINDHFGVPSPTLVNLIQSIPSSCTISAVVALFIPPIDQYQFSFKL